MRQGRQWNQNFLGSLLNQGPCWGPFYKGAVLYWGRENGPDVENYLYWDGLEGTGRLGEKAGFPCF